MSLLRSASDGRITDPDAIAVFFEVSRASRLEPFFRAACSVAEAAEEAHIKANTMYRWVEKCCALGILQQVATRPKRGRPQKLYSTTAETFFVPFEATLAPTLEAMLGDLDGAFELRFRRHVAQARQRVVGTWGYQIGADNSGLWFRAAKNSTEPIDLCGPDEPAVMSVWYDELYLSAEDAKALQRELYRRFGKLYEASQRGPGTRRYLLRLGLTPGD